MSIIRRAKVYIIIAIIMAGFLLFNGNFFSLMHNAFTLKKLNAKAAALDEEYQELNEEYQKILAGDDSYLQKTARTKYHMVKPGEIEFRIEK